MKTVMIYPVDGLLEGDIIKILEDFRGENLVKSFQIQNLKVERGSSGISCCYIICDSAKNLNDLISSIDGKKFGTNQITATLINPMVEDEIGMSQDSDKYAVQDIDIERMKYPYLPYYNADGYSNQFNNKKNGLQKERNNIYAKGAQCADTVTDDALRVMISQYATSTASGTLRIPQFTEISVGPFPRESSLFISSSFPVQIDNEQTTNSKELLTKKEKEKEKERKSSSSKSKHRRHHHRHHHRHHRRRHHRKRYSSSSSSSPSSDSTEYSSSTESNSPQE